MASTKGNFSKAPSDVLADASSKGYVAAHVEQGVPVLDRDLNLIGDLLTTMVQQIVRRHIGNGVATSGEFQVVANGTANDFTVKAGTCVVDGSAVTLPSDTPYSTQTVPATANPPGPLPPLTQPTAAQPDPRSDVVYVDVWLDEIDDANDANLGNPSDVGVRTSTRLKVQFVVRVAENASAPPAPPTGHSYYVIAQLARPTGVGVISSTQISDVRQKSLSMAALEARLRSLEGLLAPQVTTFSPQHVIAGQAVPITILGKNFLVGTVHVLLGSVAGVVDPTTTNTTLVVKVPFTATPGTWQVTVTNDVGSAVAAQPVTIDPPPPPPKFASPGAQISPAHAAANATVQLNGTNFLGVNRVTFNAPTPIAALPGGDLLSVTATAIRVNVPAAVPVSTTCTLTASIDGVPTMTATTTDLFTVDPAAPPPPPPAFGAIGHQFSPQTQTHGGTVTLSGTNFGTSTSTTQIVFNGTNTVNATGTDVVSVTPTQIQVKVPAALTVGAAPNNKATITVTVNGLSITSNDLLTVV